MDEKIIKIKEHLKQANLLIYDILKENKDMSISVRASETFLPEKREDFECFYILLNKALWVETKSLEDFKEEWSKTIND